MQPVWTGNVFCFLAACSFFAKYLVTDEEVGKEHLGQRPAAFHNGRFLLSEDSRVLHQERTVVRHERLSQDDAECKHQRNISALNADLDLLKHLIVDGDYKNLKSLLLMWSASHRYVHNLNSTESFANYSQMQCSDLDYLARHHVLLDEFVYNTNFGRKTKRTDRLTVLELALHMTRHANERALMRSFRTTEHHAQEAGASMHDRVRIIQLLLENGFLWDSGDLVCKVVRPANGYRPTIRAAFARAILHDVVRDMVHLNRSRINFLRNSELCGGNDMDGVVWILAQAPEAFTMLSLSTHKTVLMQAAEDPDDHDDELVNFPELIRLHTVMQAPLTTVNPDGWNAEMLAAGQLNAAHVGYVQRAVARKWRDEYREAFSIPFLPEDASDALADTCVAASGHIFLLTMACAAMLVLFLTCSAIKFPAITPVTTLQCMDMMFRVLWLFVLNTAFLTVPPVILTACRKHVSVFAVPHVAKWNPLPLTIKLVLVVCAIIVACFMFADATKIYEMRKDRETAPATAQDKEATPQDRYQDPNSPLLGCICIYLLMTFLMIIYLQTVMNPLAMDPKRVGLWLGALLVQVRFTLDDNTVQEEVRHDGHTLRHQLMAFFRSHAHSSESHSRDLESPCSVPEPDRNVVLSWTRWASCMVTPENSKIWMLHLDAWEGNCRLLCSHEPGEPANMIENKDKKRQRHPWNKCQIWSRFVMSYLSNGLYKAILVYTLPLWLCRGGLADFVLNAFALVYIVELDDTKDRDKWRLEDDEESCKEDHCDCSELGQYTPCQQRDESRNTDDSEEGH